MIQWGYGQAQKVGGSVHGEGRAGNRHGEGVNGGIAAINLFKHDFSSPFSAQTINSKQSALPIALLA